MKKDIIKNMMENESMKLFTMLCTYFLILLITFTGCKLFYIRHCLGFVQVISVVVPIILYLINSKKNLKKNIIVLLSYLFIILVLPFIFGKTYDLTVDGNSYHKTAIAFLKNGWNPIYENSEDFQKNNDNIIKFDEESNIDLWINHYPKSTWIVAATMYDMTGNIESGKAINGIFTIMLIIVAYNVLQLIITKKYISLIISILIGLNPIMLSQFFTYYVDGLMGVCFAIELLLLMLINPMEKQNKKIWLSLFGICSVFVNIKFTGLLYSGLIAAVFYFYWLFKYIKDKEFLKRFTKITIYFIIIFFTSILFIGANSYVKNTIDHCNPLYPLIGKDKVDIITTMQPKSFKEKNMFEKFAISLFSKTENITYYGGEPKLKLPFKVDRTEIVELLQPDVRIGGFGPLFTFALIIALVTLIPSLYLLIKNEKQNLKYILLTLSALLITTLFVGESWWARYVPQLYLLPIGCLILLVYTSKYYKKTTICKSLIIIYILAILSNTYMFKYTFKELLSSFKSIDKDLIELKNMEDLELKLGGMQNLYGYFYNLNDKEINYKIVKEIPAEESRYMFSWRIQIRNK